MDFEMNRISNACRRDDVLMAKQLFLALFFSALLVEFAVGQVQEEIESSAIIENQISDTADGLADIEYTISDEAASGLDAIGTNDIAIKPRSYTEIYLCLGVLAFGLVLVLFTGYVASKKSSGWDQDATKIFAVSVIITAGLFLITAGYSDQQIAPMFGLLGTIVGYLLGKSPSGEQGPKQGG